MQQTSRPIRTGEPVWKSMARNPKTYNEARRLYKLQHPNASQSEITQALRKEIYHRQSP